MDQETNLLREKLLTNFVSVVFTKKDGTERTMICTLKPDALPPQIDIEESIQKRKPNENIISVYDMEKADWRSFRIDSIISWRVV